MTVTTYAGWIADGSPVQYAQPILDLGATLRRYGYTVYMLGNQSHLTAEPPEDHTPFSNTPWPGIQPYPHVMAMDIMPGGPVEWETLGELVEHDRDANVPGTEWIKYVNYTDTGGHCWHYSWEPAEQGGASTDTGHIHISCRTDYVSSTVAAGYDPVARLLGGDMDQGELVKYWNNMGRQGVTVGWTLGDLENLRDFLVTPLGKALLVPGDGSPLDLILKAAQSQAPATPGGGLTDADRAAIQALTDAVNALNSRLASP